MAIELEELTQNNYTDNVLPMPINRPRHRRRLPAILRPRLTPKYVFSSFVLLYASYCILSGMPFFSSNLPEYTGPYPVGTIDIESPCDGRLTSDIDFKATGKPAFEV